MIIDPRKEFFETDNGKRWHNATAEDWFREGLRLALQTMPASIADNQEAAAANWWKSQGARQLSEHILTLTEFPNDRKINNKANLIQP